MRRTTSLTAATLLGAALFTAPSATAVGETCRGEVATIVGIGPSIVGTEGRDVIVSGTASTVNALAGDDLVCLTGTDVDNFSIRVDAGSGSDTVDATATTAVHTRVDLGAGADAFSGGQQSDDVQASGYVAETGAQIPDTERDVIDTGGGHDRIASFASGVANPDVISAGTDSDHVYAEGPMAAGARIDGGEGLDELAFERFDTGRLVMDAAQGTASLDGAAWLRWSGMEHLSFHNFGQVDLDYTGSDGDDWLSVHTLGGSERSVSATMGEGDDRLTLNVSGPFERISAVGGGGRDTLEPIGRTSMDVDLSAGTLTWDGQTHAIHTIENVSAVGTTVRLTGDNGPNVLEGGPCVTRIRGGGGADDLGRRGEPAGERIGVPCTRFSNVLDGGAGNDRLDGSGRTDKLHGGGGNDQLTGRRGRDTLIGDQGRDTAAGGPGRDTCKTEIRKACER